jgi:hypothetical protein
VGGQAETFACVDVFIMLAMAASIMFLMFLLPSSFVRTITRLAAMWRLVSGAI